MWSPSRGRLSGSLNLSGNDGRGRGTGPWPLIPWLRPFGRAAGRARAACEKECLAAEREPDPGFLVDVRFHDLRHEVTSRLFERGRNTLTVSADIGHKTLQRLKRYTHLRAETIVRERDRTESRRGEKRLPTSR